eukprot:6599534-Heterocapsa_arctica.AAC.2
MRPPRRCSTRHRRPPLCPPLGPMGPLGPMRPPRRCSTRHRRPPLCPPLGPPMGPLGPPGSGGTAVTAELDGRRWGRRCLRRSPVAPRRASRSSRGTPVRGTRRAACS